MNKKSVSDFIDRRIEKCMVDGISIPSIKDEIATRGRNMNKGIANVINIDDFETLLKFNLEDIKNSRIKYTAFYVSHSRKRINDLDWIVTNKKKFPKLSNSQIFNLVKLKEKLQPNL